MNDDPKIHGILVQLPLPSHIDSSSVLNALIQKKMLMVFIHLM